MKTLPQSNPTMITPQGIFLELLHLLIDGGVVSEELAITHYQSALKKYSGWQK